MAEETTTTTTETVDYKAEFEKMQNDYAKLKSNFDKTSSEVADYKRKERERMSEDEKRSAENAERETYYKELERKLAMKDYADELSDIADTKTKDNIVSLFADGKIVEAMNKHKEYRAKDRGELEKRIKADLMRKNPEATAASSTPAKTKEEIMAVKDAVERQRLIAENIKLFQ
jgi:hypothetical protein